MDEPRDAHPGGTNDYAAMKVLLVEDSMLIAIDTDDCLRELGVGEVRIVGTVAAALDALTDFAPNLVLLDYSLGTETGEQVAAELVRSSIPFWLATGDSELEARLSELGASGLLIKPYGKRELVELLAAFSGPA